MTYGLLKYTTDNIGDDIQSLAARAFLPDHFDFFDRDALSLASPQENTKIILNGWFLHQKNKTINFPPHSNFDPLFIAFHCARENILDSEQIRRYFKQYAPIGCRDYGTVELFQNKGIDAYYSGCLTLTIKRPQVEKDNAIIFVDPFGHDGNWNYPCPGNNFPGRIWEKIAKDVRDQSRFLSHSFAWNFAPAHLRLELAKEFINIYARAKFVITSRIHAALPCLAIGTPVLLITTKLTKDEYRLRGIKELFHTMTLEEYLENNNNIDHFNPSKNPGLHIPIAEKLRIVVNNWLNV